MSKRKKTQILSPQEGYNRIANQYKDYHRHLTSFDHGLFKRYLPRDMKNTAIIDLGAGDGRMYNLIHDQGYTRYVACDISQELLDKHPGQDTGVETITCDLENKLPLHDKQFDLALSFFVLEHINDLDSLIQEVYRILTPGGRRIIGHFLQRRTFVWHDKGDKFKIEQYNHRIEDIQKSLEENRFSLHIQPVIEQGMKVGYIIVCDK